jgi:hypothetical protein
VSQDTATDIAGADATTADLGGATPRSRERPGSGRSRRLNTARLGRAAATLAGFGIAGAAIGAGTALAYTGSTYCLHAHASPGKDTCTNGTWNHMTENLGSAGNIGFTPIVCTDEFQDPHGTGHYTAQRCRSTSVSSGGGSVWGTDRTWLNYSYGYSTSHAGYFWGG